MDTSMENMHGTTNILQFSGYQPCTDTNGNDFQMGLRQYLEFIEDVAAPGQVYGQGPPWSTDNDANLNTSFIAAPALTEDDSTVDLENAALGPNFDGCPAKNGTGGGIPTTGLSRGPA